MLQEDVGPQGQPPGRWTPPWGPAGGARSRLVGRPRAGRHAGGHALSAAHAPHTQRQRTPVSLAPSPARLRRRPSGSRTGAPGRRCGSSRRSWSTEARSFSVGRRPLLPLPHLNSSLSRIADGRFVTAKACAIGRGEVGRRTREQAKRHDGKVPRPMAHPPIPQTSLSPRPATALLRASFSERARRPSARCKREGGWA